MRKIIGCLEEIAIQRFKQKVKFLLPDSNGCIIWPYHIMSKGYGRVRVKDKCFRAHRIAFMAKNGNIPRGLHVCHTCDVRNCVNPNHLFLGTDKDNMLDGSRKGSILKKLTVFQVNRIYEKYRTTKISQRKLAKQYGVLQSTIWRLLKDPDRYLCIENRG